MTPPPVQPCAGGALLFVRVTPKAREDGFGGLVTRDGRQRLSVRVRAAPADNAANDAVAALIAKSIRCKASAVSIAAGRKDRDNTVLIAGGDAHKIQAWAEETASGGGAD